MSPDNAAWYSISSPLWKKTGPLYSNNEIVFSVVHTVVNLLFSSFSHTPTCRLLIYPLPPEQQLGPRHDQHPRIPSCQVLPLRRQIRLRCRNARGRRSDCQTFYRVFCIAKPESVPHVRLLSCPLPLPLTLLPNVPLLISYLYSSLCYPWKSGSGLVLIADRDRLDHARLQPGAGFPDHPHRGQTTVSYVLCGYIFSSSLLTRGAYGPDGLG